MVPFEAFSIEAPQSSSAFCSGCDGGTQWERRSSKVLSCANAVPAHNAMTAPSAADRMFMKILPVDRFDLGACAPIVAIATDTIRAGRARQPVRDRAIRENLCR